MTPIVSLASRPDDPDPSVTIMVARKAGLTLSFTRWPALTVTPAEKLTPEIRTMILIDKWAIIAGLLELRLLTGVNDLRSLEAQKRAQGPEYARRLRAFEILKSWYEAAWMAATDPEFRARLEGLHAAQQTEAVAA